MVFREDQSPGLVLTDEFALNVSHLIRAVLFKHSQHPGSQVTHYCSHRLPMVLTVVDHLAMVDSSKLRIPPAADISRLVKSHPHDGRPSFGHSQPLGLSIGGLPGSWHYSLPIGKSRLAPETCRIAYCRQEDWRRMFPNARYGARIVWG